MYQLSQSGLAKHLGIDRLSVYRYEAGHVPKMQILRRLAGMAADKGRFDLCRTFIYPISKELETPVAALQPVLCGRAA